MKRTHKKKFYRKFAAICEIVTIDCNLVTLKLQGKYFGRIMRLMTVVLILSALLCCMQEAKGRTRLLQKAANITEWRSTKPFGDETIRQVCSTNLCCPSQLRCCFNHYYCCMVTSYVYVF